MNATISFTFSLESISSSNSHQNVTNVVLRHVTPVEIVASVLSSLAILTNTCVIFVLLVGPRAFRKPAFYFVANLASANLLSGVAVISVIFAPAGGTLLESIILKGIAVVSFSVSVNSLVLITCDRFIKLVYDKKYNKIFNYRNSILFIIFTWIFAIIVFLLAPLFGWSCRNSLCNCGNDSTCECDIHVCAQYLTPFTKDYLLVGVIYFYVCIAAMFAFCVLLMQLVKANFDEQNRCNCCIIGQLRTYGPFEIIQRKREFCLAKTLIIVLITFFICWLPITTLFIVDIVSEVRNMENTLEYCLFGPVLYPIINPIIYTKRLPRMWSTFKYLAFAIWRRISRVRIKRMKNALICFPAQDQIIINQQYDPLKKRNQSNSGESYTHSLDLETQTHCCETEIINQESEFRKALKRLQTPITFSYSSARANNPNHLACNSKQMSRSEASYEHQKEPVQTTGKKSVATTKSHECIKISSPFNAEIRYFW